ncbi:MAG TPA: hypothetical protein VNA31_00850 [bacterium]|nr:hypothetical protein [bacterium]
MGFRILAGLTAPKILKPLLLVVVLIGLVGPGSGVALSQSSTRISGQAPLYTAIDLHPSGFVESHGRGISGEQQVGDIWVPPGIGETHAVVWRGSAANMVDLHPRGFSEGSDARGVCGGEQVGAGFPNMSGDRNLHALLWRGSAASAVDLNPRGFLQSVALGTSGDQQVGEGDWAYLTTHALLWRGSATSVVDLNPRGFEQSHATATSGDQQVGWGFGPATGGEVHALLWHGSADNVVDLHPLGFTLSAADGTFGGQQVGVASNSGWDNGHALMWRGSAASAVDLNPHGFTSSRAHATNGEEQVGSGVPEGAPLIVGYWGHISAAHALLWRGNAASVVDLHPFLPPRFVESTASGIDAAGNVVGEASDAGARPHAFLWRRNVPNQAHPAARTLCDAGKR